MNDYTEGRVRKNKISPSTQRTNCGLRAVKIDGNAESRARHKEDSWDVIDGDVEDCNQEGTSACSKYTLV